MKPLPVLFLVLGFALSLHAPPALAQTPRKEVSRADKARAGRLAAAGEKSYKKDDYQKALESYQEAYELNPETEYIAAVGDCYNALILPQKALEAYNEFLKKAEYSHPLRSEIEKKVKETSVAAAKAARTSGDLAMYTEKDYKVAIGFYQKSYDISKDAALYYKIGLCYFNLESYKEGIEAFDFYLLNTPASDPDRAETEKQITALQEDVAASSFEAGQYEEALALYRALYARDAKPSRFVELGRCYQKMGQTEEANTAFRNFLEKAVPDDPLRPEIEALLPGAFSGNDKKPEKKDPKEQGPSSPLPRVFLGGAVLTGALGATAGVLAFVSARRLNTLTSISAASELDAEAIATHQARRAILAPAADILLGAAVVTGVLGLATRAKAKKEAPRAALSLSPAGVVLSVRY